MIETYPKKGLFGKLPPVKEAAEIMRFNENVSWAYASILPEKFSGIYYIFKYLPFRRRAERAKRYLLEAKKNLEEIGV